ncbi:hypothetical protein J2X45_003322 [Caulobacter sp. BE264]|uniref:hypothetical protein n=1 Tax=Caulobacter sp. BE264 TaxID=2817724 RepID=UPI00285AFB68|nr:hypothetical protein [Caulobacter sp. BE264]MDR7232216.1 hypothetical protein [Caulobacter sp. BE264]
MRRVLLALIVIAMAAPALAGQARLPATTKSPPAQTPIAAPSIVLPAPIPLAVGRPGGDVAQCRATCARTLYFCQSTEDDGCGARWAQCNAACTATYSAARFGR